MQALQSHIRTTTSYTSENKSLTWSTLKIFSLTSNHRLKLTVAECRYSKDEVELLGHTVRWEDILVNPSKVTATKTLLLQATRPSSKVFTKRNIFKSGSSKYSWIYQKYFILRYPYWTICTGITAWKKWLKMWTVLNAPVSAFLLHVA